MNVFEVLRQRGFVDQVTSEQELRDGLASSRMTIYAGFDPTADSLHVGHLLPLMALRWLQRAGHRVIAVVGGGTAMVGDPSGKTELRQQLTVEQVGVNAAALKQQIARFVSVEGDAGLMVDNADWLLGLNYIAFLRDIGSCFSVNRMLTAEAYKLRLERGLSFIEFNYQILQAYDFLELFRRYGCQVQIGGSDQWGNIVAGTDLIRRIEGHESRAFGLTLPLIMTTSGEKMGKTAKGALWLDPLRTAPFDFYQYWLNVADADVGRLLRLYTDLPFDGVLALEALEGADTREAKRRLAHEVTALVHGADAASEAARAAEAMVRGEASAALPGCQLDASWVEGGGVAVVAALVAAGLAASRSAARRLIDNGGVRVDNDKVTTADATIPVASLAGDGVVLRVGKKNAARLTIG